MKAILNGAGQLSTTEAGGGEAGDKNIGRIFGYAPPPGEIGSESDLKLDQDSKELYKSLEEMAALYYATAYGKTAIEASPWLEMMINCLSESGFFNTQRMILEYKDRIWQA